MSKTIGFEFQNNLGSVKNEKELWRGILIQAQKN